MTTSYARAVMSGNKIIGRRPNLMRVTPVGTSSYSSMHLNIPTEKWTWLNNSWVERLKNLAMFDRWNGREDIKPKYLGDDMVLLVGLTNDRAVQLGIPPHAWDLEYIKQIVLATEEVVIVDDDVDEFQRMDMVRVLIKTSWKPLI
ncbi:hypothetical protein GmHk_03G006451 [Glycine max]|nr:hypothetical protein GmHk_03G006451 [Glycine max]